MNVDCHIFGVNFLFLVSIRVETKIILSINPNFSVAVVVIVVVVVVRKIGIQFHAPGPRPKNDFWRTRPDYLPKRPGLLANVPCAMELFSSRR